MTSSSQPETVSRPDLEVMYLEVPDVIESIREGWERLEALVPLKGRRFLAAVPFSGAVYQVCTVRRDDDDPDELGLATQVVPGGDYLRVRLRGQPPEVYEHIGPTVELLEAARERDPHRPIIEVYRRVDEIDVLLPV
jgi:hypothetical protein